MKLEENETRQILFIFSFVVVLSDFVISLKAWKDLLLFLMTFLLTIILGVDLGIFIALAVSVFLVIRHSSLPHIAVLGRMPKSKSYRDIAQFPQARIIPVHKSTLLFSCNNVKLKRKQIDDFFSTTV